MPSAERYAAKVEIEQMWFTAARTLSAAPIHETNGHGENREKGYPWAWSIYRWIEGNTASSAHITSLRLCNPTRTVPLCLCNN